MSQLSPGSPAPDLSLVDFTGEPFTLESVRGRKVIVYFFPAAMTPGCSLQAEDFRDNLSSFSEAGYEVIGVSPDAPEKLAEFHERDRLTYPLLSDQDRSTMTAWGAYGEKTLYGKVVTGVIRSTVVVDEQGVVTLAKYNVKAKGHVAMLRKALGLV